jgi:hypothetical protein
MNIQQILEGMKMQKAKENLTKLEEEDAAE